MRLSRRSTMTTIRSCSSSSAGGWNASRPSGGPSKLRRTPPPPTSSFSAWRSAATSSAMPSRRQSRHEPWQPLAGRDGACPPCEDHRRIRSRRVRNRSRVFDRPLREREKAAQAGVLPGPTCRPTRSWRFATPTIRNCFTAPGLTTRARPCRYCWERPPSGRQRVPVDAG